MFNFGPLANLCWAQQGIGVEFEDAEENALTQHDDA